MNVMFTVCLQFKCVPVSLKGQAHYVELLLKFYKEVLSVFALMVFYGGLLLYKL